MPDNDIFIPHQGPKRQADCPHCSNRVAMSLRNLRWIDPEIKTPGDTQRPGQHVEEQVWSCDFCDKAVVELYSVDRLPMENIKHVAGTQKHTLISRVWPAQEPRPLSQDAPDKVRGLFLEAGRAEEVAAFRLAEVGYRSIAEEICKERGAQGKNLHAMIGDRPYPRPDHHTKGVRQCGASSVPARRACEPDDRFAKDLLVPEGRSTHRLRAKTGALGALNGICGPQ
ncbi:hypothetical protein [Streptomyces sp. NPDC055287]